MELAWPKLADIPANVSVVYDNQDRMWERQGQDWVTNGSYIQRLSTAVTDLSGWGPFAVKLDEAVLRQHVVGELDRIIEELSVPYNTGLIATSLARQLRRVVRDWPNVLVNGMVVGQPTEGAVREQV